MADKTNRARVGEAFEQLATGLEPFVDRVMSRVYPKGVDWAAEFHRRSHIASQDFSRHDPSFQLNVMIESWDPHFKRVLPNGIRNRLFMLRTLRNDWAHNKAFKATDAHEALLSVINLLEAIDASEVDAVQASLDELLRSMYATAAQTPGGSNVLDVPVKNLRPWRQVIIPHDDVARGNFNVAEFAADLELVRRGEASAEYGNPELFFERTFITGGLRELLSLAVHRIAGHGGQPVINCQTNFGGGKTHSLIALYHLFSGIPLEQLPAEVRQIAADAGVDNLPAVQRAVVVGNRFAAGDTHPKPDGTVVHTVWGEIAWQLGGADGYALVAASDQSRTNPGDALRTLFAACGPCLVLIDEWVAYARELYGRDDLTGGSFESQFSFAQALTESVRATPGCLFVVSIPASEGLSDASDDSVSDTEVGGPAGREALRRLSQVVTRQAEHWQPATSDESFEIVRRRLFEPLASSAEAHRDETAEAFGQLYRSNRSEFPTECGELRYVDRIRSAYPIHPELFDRLYQNWSTVERFQRTRGVLRLMAAVIHALWTSDDQSPLILPCSVPLDHPRVIGELTGKLDDNWRPVIDTDVDGPGSRPAQIDRSVTHLGSHHGARRVARTIFLGATPTVKSPNRGLETERVKLGSVFATERPAAFVPDALNRLMQQSSHLYIANNRYWFELQENVSRTARDEAERLMTGDRHEIHEEIVKRLRAQRGDGAFRRVHIAPTTSGDIADDPMCRLVVLGPDAPHIAKSEEASPAQVAARGLLDRRGNSARQYRNTIVFAACDQRGLEALEHATADFLAWSGICSRADDLNLDTHNRSRAEASRDQASETIHMRLGDSYQWVLVPRQDDPTGDIVFDSERTDSQGSVAERASRKLASSGSLLTQFPAVMLRLKLDNELSPLWATGHVAVNELWDNFAKYVYLPRLVDIDVLIETVRNGGNTLLWETEGFATAAAWNDDNGRYLGLNTGSVPDGIGPTSLVVKPDVAIVQAGSDDSQGTDDVKGTGGTGTTVIDGDKAPPPPTHPTRFVGAIELSSDRPVRDFGQVSEEILNHFLAKPGTEVTIRVEIEATRLDGFDDATVRTVTENSRTLKFGDHGFSTD